MRLETETETVEFKSTLAELKQGLISLVAMLNKHGEASLWFGAWRTKASCERRRS